MRKVGAVTANVSSQSVEKNAPQLSWRVRAMIFSVLIPDRAASLRHNPALAMLDPAQALGEVSFKLGDGNALLGPVHGTSLVTRSIDGKGAWGNWALRTMPSLAMQGLG